MIQRHVLRAALALACLSSLSACDRTRSSAQAAVRERLKDPDSAKFGDFYFNKATGTACIEVNAKNAMGGYTGNSAMVTHRTKDGWDPPYDTELSMADCKEVIADKKTS